MQLNNFIYSCLYKQLFDNAQPIAFICVQNYPLKINLHSGSFFTFQPPFAADPKVFFENDCRKRKYSLQSLFEAVLYLLATADQKIQDGLEYGAQGIFAAPAIIFKEYFVYIRPLTLGQMCLIEESYMHDKTFFLLTTLWLRVFRAPNV